MDALLETDEETDAGAFAAYLRAQSDADLLDIQSHLDVERYPARVDIVRREVSRRCVLPITLYSSEEKFVRGAALGVLSFAGMTFFLTLVLTAADAAGSRWVSLSQIPDGTPVSVIMRLALLGILRAVFVESAAIALAPLAALMLSGWLIARFGNHAIRADAKGLVLLSLLALFLSFTLAAAPGSNIPLLFDPSSGNADFWARLISLICPFW